MLPALGDLMSSAQYGVGLSGASVSGVFRAIWLKQIETMFPIGCPNEMKPRIIQTSQFCCIRACRIGCNTETCNSDYPGAMLRLHCNPDKHCVLDLWANWRLGSLHLLADIFHENGLCVMSSCHIV